MRAWRDLGIAPPARVVDTSARMPRSEVSIVFTGPFEDSGIGRRCERRRFFWARLSDALRGSRHSTRFRRVGSAGIRGRNIASPSTGRAIPQVDVLVKRVFQSGRRPEYPISGEQIVRITFLQRDPIHDTENGFFLTHFCVTTKTVSR